jgi:LacI family transcriptional regulator, galactose operon repressor
MHGNPHEATSAVRTMRGRVDGLLVMSPDVQRTHLLDALSPAIPAVLLDCHDPTPGLASVGIDNEGGAREMTNFLIARGYRRIAFVSGPRNNRDSAAREAGFVAALAAATGERHPLIVAGDFSEASGAEAARLLIAGRMPVDAIFCANDMMAIGCCGVLADAGIAVGADIGVAGFDDIPIAHYTAPALTTMNARIAELGAVAAEKLIRMISDPGSPRDATILAPQLIARASTAGRGAPRIDDSADRIFEKGSSS